MEKYIILRDLGVRTKGFGPRTFAKPEPKIETAVLTSGNAEDARRDPAVAAVAPTFSTTLIKPVSTSNGTLAAPATPPWGLAATNALASQFKGDGVVVAILDTGIDATHPAFAGVELDQEDFSGDGNGDVNGHGTHCAGTIFGRAVAGTRIGIAPGIKKALIGKVLQNAGGGDSEMIFRGLQWAINAGVDVISMSLGFDFPGYVKQRVEKELWPVDLATSDGLVRFRDNLRMFDALMDLARANASFDEGAVIVAATGNESRTDPENGKLYRISVSLPAASQGIISVGAVEPGPQGFSVATFSNTPPRVAAPGVNIISAKMGGGLTAMSGTSMACPHTAGVVALWWDALRQASKRTSARAVEAKLLASLRTNVFAPGVTQDERGDGLITAP